MFEFGKPLEVFLVTNLMGPKLTKQKAVKDKSVLVGLLFNEELPIMNGEGLQVRSVGTECCLTAEGIS